MKSKFRAAALACVLVCPLGGVPRAGEAPPSPAKCTAAEQRQFDFWVGEWDVTEKGKPAGHSRIERILDGCALLENWSGAGGSEGRSLNFFDRDDGRWHQAWIDAAGEALFLSGRFADGAMRLEGERRATGKQPAMRHRITWTRLPDGTVRQLWESSPPGSERWQVMFDGHYAPRAAPN